MSCSDFGYTGPHADFASLTGSPIWALPIDAVVEAYQKRGWAYDGGRRVPTPYGLGPEVHAFRVPTAQGERRFLWIPSYGDVLGEETQSLTTLRPVFWILWKAGVEVLLVGGNSGICDWRQTIRPDEAIQPGDVVLPWSFRTHPDHRGLPGTPFAAPWPRHNLFLDAPFCPTLAEAFLPLLRPFVEKGTLRKIHTPAEVRAALVQVETVTFETDFDILMWRAITKTISELEPDKPPVVTLHGDCVNPILARFLGIHVLYYHLVCNHAQGLGGEIHDTLTGLFLHDYPAMTLALEAEAAERLALPGAGGCRCRSALIPNPAVFAEAMSGNRDLS